MLLKSLAVATTLLALTLSAAISGPEDGKGGDAQLPITVAMATPTGG